VNPIVSVPAGVSPTFWRLVTEEPLADFDVLDVGTGSGRVALALARLCRRVVGLDRDGGALAVARQRAAAASLGNVEFIEGDADKRGDYFEIAAGWENPDLIVAHLCVSDDIIENASKSLAPGRVLALVAFHTDQWCETGRASRFAYDEARLRGELAECDFAVEHLEVEREVQRFASVEEALAAAIGLEERWRADGRWFNYVRFLEQGGRTLTRSHLIVKARRV
jgi:SAM-dependent methyltransferase